VLDLLKDIYYYDTYIELYLRDNEELFKFEYKDGDNIFINKTIKRPIKNIGNINIDDGYYDLEPAYGYGGFYINSKDKGFISTAVRAYEKKCLEENIIAEFIRFHPFNDFPIDNANLLDFNIRDRDVVIKNVDKDIISSYNSKVRNTIKRALEKVEIRQSKDIDKFQELYNATMKKNGASDFYYFSKKYYEELIKNKSVELYECLHDGQVIAMGFFMFGNDIAHYHLSANTDISYKLNTNYALLHHLFEVAKTKGIKYFLLGGGITSNNNDSLLKFKQKFSKETKSFYISGKIYNEEVYKAYNNLWKEQSSEDIKYFLKYRLE